IAISGANILHIHHDRISKGIPIGTSKVILELETIGVDHIREILGKLRKENYPVELDKRPGRCRFPPEAHGRMWTGIKEGIPHSGGNPS
ncbi:MAG: hypothetical protein KAJ09_05825, partial [Deltaproteobacteria bacterium]|nr:hypothetical protein [Deltaproteobacteria bacterium]